MTGPERLQRQSLSLRNKLGRALWGLVWLCLYRPSPRSFHRWRCALLRAFGAKLAATARPYPSARIWAPWNLEMGEHACIGEQVDCYCVQKIVLGDYATVSQYSFLCGASHDYASLAMPLVAGSIHIGAHAWVTADVFVGPGVAIGEGAVITARSSVFSDIPAWTVARGNPAVAVKPRVITERPAVMRH